MRIFQSILWSTALYVNACSDCSTPDPGLFGPGGKALALTKSLNPSSARPVVGLCLPRCPLAIFGTVVSVVINTLKCVASWSFPHVLEEGTEVLPAVTDLDAPPTVAYVSIGVRVCTPLPHVAPYVPFRCFTQSMRRLTSAIRRLLCYLDVFPGTLISPAATTLNDSQGSLPNHLLGSTLTENSPLFTLFNYSWLKRNKRKSIDFVPRR